jgi:hypothetical protein
MAVNSTTQTDFIPETPIKEEFAQKEFIPEDTLQRSIEKHLIEQDEEDTELISSPQQEFIESFPVFGEEQESSDDTIHFKEDTLPVNQNQSETLPEPVRPTVEYSEPIFSVPVVDSALRQTNAMQATAGSIDTNLLKKVNNNINYISLFQQGELPSFPIIPNDSFLINRTLFPTEDTTRSIKNEYPGMEGKALPNTLQHQVWFTPLLFIMFFCYGVVLIRKKKTLAEEIKRFFTTSEGSNISYLGNSFSDSSQTRSFLVILGVINISLFSFYSVSELFEYKIESYVLVLTFYIVLIFIFLFFKLITIKLISYVFFDISVSAKWTRSFNSFILFPGIILIPVILLLSYGPSSWIYTIIYIGIFVCFCFFILYLFQVITFFFQGVYSLFYLILYLCTLEFLPLIALLWGLVRVSKSYNLILM